MPDCDFQSTALAGGTHIAKFRSHCPGSYGSVARRYLEAVISGLLAKLSLGAVAPLMTACPPQRRESLLEPFVTLFTSEGNKIGHPRFLA